MRYLIPTLVLVSAVPRLAAVVVGQTRNALIEELGPPSSSLERGEDSLLRFHDGSVVSLHSGMVTAVRHEDSEEVRSNSATNTLDPEADPRSRHRIFFAGVVSVLVGLILFRMFFDSFHEFTDCVRLYLQPDIFSALRGEYWEDTWASAKLFIWFCCMCVSGLLCYAYSGGTLGGLLHFVGGR